MKKQPKHVPVSEETQKRLKDLTTPEEGVKKSFDLVIRELLEFFTGKKNPE